MLGGGYMSVTKAVGHTTVAGLSDPPVNATHSPAQHTTPSMIFFFYFLGRNVCWQSSIAAAKKGLLSISCWCSSSLLYILFFFLVFILYSYIFLYGYDNKRAAVPLFGSTPHSIVERETVGGGTPSVMFLARGSTPNILYTSFFFSFFSLFSWRERDIFL